MKNAAKVSSQCCSAMLLVVCLALSVHSVHAITINRKVLLPDNRPAVGAKVTLAIRSGKVGKTRNTRVRELTKATDARGEYSFEVPDAVRLADVLLMVDIPGFGTGA